MKNFTSYKLRVSIANLLRSYGLMVLFLSSFSFFLSPVRAQVQFYTHQSVNFYTIGGGLYQFFDPFSYNIIFVMNSEGHLELCYGKDTIGVISSYGVYVLDIYGNKLNYFSNKDLHQKERFSVKAGIDFTKKIKKFLQEKQGCQLLTTMVK